LDVEAAMPEVRKQMLQRSMVSLQAEKNRQQKQLQELQEESKLNQIPGDIEDESPPLCSRKQIETTDPITHTDRCKLCNAVNGLQDKYMPGIIRILTEEVPNVLKNGQPVCDVDIDSLPPLVLRRLLIFIEDCRRKDEGKEPSSKTELTATTENSQSVAVNPSGPSETQPDIKPDVETTKEPAKESSSSATSSSETSDTSSEDSD